MIERTENTAIKLNKLSGLTRGAPSMRKKGSLNVQIDQAKVNLIIGFSGKRIKATCSSTYFVLFNLCLFLFGAAEIGN